MQLIYFALLAALTAPLSVFAATRPSIETVRKVAKKSPDGRSVVLTSVYHYGFDSLGHRTFLDSNGHPYTGSDTFVWQLAAALGRIEDGGPNGKALIGYFDHVDQSTIVIPAPTDEADIVHGEYVHWNPENLHGAPDEAGGNSRPAFIGLAHELVHITDVWRGTVNRNTWKELPGEGDELIMVPYAELYATRMENKIRAENGIPLRVSYAAAVFGPEGVRQRADAASLLLRPGTRQSLYYNCQGYTTYHRLGKREQPETY